MKYVIKGPNKAEGALRVSGSKNFSIKALTVSLLVRGCVFYENVPNNLDVVKTLNMLKELGAIVIFDNEACTCKIDTSNITNIIKNAEHANMIMFVIGAGLIHSYDFTSFPKNQGCSLGNRAIDYHINAFSAMGAIYAFDEEKQMHTFKKHGQLQGSNIHLNFPSVGATETAIFLAVLANGITKISNIAIEPEIIALITSLNELGACIFFDEDRTIIIHGVKELAKNRKIQIHGDLLEVATWASLAAATNGRIIVNGFVPEMMGSFLGLFNLLGGCFERIASDSLCFYKNDIDNNAHKISISTGVFPMFRTDLQPILAAFAASNPKSTLIIHETIYDDRLSYLKTFEKFGVTSWVDENCFGSKCRFNNKSLHSAIIKGNSNLKAPNDPIIANTIRDTIANIIMASAATGTTVIENTKIVERGYSNLAKKLLSLNIDIQQIEDAIENAIEDTIEYTIEDAIEDAHKIEIGL